MPARVLFATACQPGINPGEYIHIDIYYNRDRPDDDYLEYDSTPAFSCTPYSIQPGAEIDRFCVPNSPTGEQTIVRAPANPQAAVDPTDPAGQLQITTAPNPGACPVNSSGLAFTSVTATNPTAAGLSNGSIAFTIASTAGPVTVTIPGRSVTLTGSEPFTGSFTGLPEGQYTVRATDGTTLVITRAVTLAVVGMVRWLKYQVVIIPGQDGDPDQYEATGTIWNPVAKRVETYTALVDSPSFYSRPITEVVDAYFLSDGRTYRSVFHDTNGGVEFRDVQAPVEATRGTTRITNIIITDIDQPGTATGSLWVEAETPAPPLAYTLTPAPESEETSGGAGVQNGTGQFSALAADRYRVDVTDANGTTVSEFVYIKDEYRPRWELVYDTPQGVRRRAVISERGYTGTVQPMCMGGDPEILAWAETGTDPDGVLPDAIGYTAQLTIRTAVPEQFQAVAEGDDRKFRYDSYAGPANAEELLFRGYLLPDVYRRPLLGGEVEISLTAADGLGGLQDTAFLNHRGELMDQRRPLLSTLLHCLSRTDTNLPLHVGVNLRDVLMAADADPLLSSWARRDAYAEPGKETDCRTVINAILAPFNALLNQRNGAWWVLALNEVTDDSYGIRTFAPNGVLLGEPDVPEAWHIRAAGTAEAPGRLQWRQASQEIAILPATKALISRVKLQLIENQLADGTFQQWAPGATAPAGWIADTITVRKLPGEKANTWLLGIDYNPLLVNGKLISPVLTHRNGQDEEPLYLYLKARVPAVKRADGVAERAAGAIDYSPTATFITKGQRVLAGSGSGLKLYEALQDMQRSNLPNNTIPVPTGYANDLYWIERAMVQVPISPQPILRLRVQTVVDGVPAPEQRVFEWKAGEKEDEQDTFLPVGLTGNTVRIYLNAPELVGNYIADTYDSPLRVEILELKLAILPDSKKWPEEDQSTALNPLPAFTQAPDVELVHADLPRQADANGQPAPFRGMAVQAWRHALSTEDEQATTAWQRPAAVEAGEEGLTLLEQAALDRLELLARPGVVLSGPVAGIDVYRLGVGHVLDAPDDEVDGRFLVVGCSIAERGGQATISVRRMTGGSYTTPSELPAFVRITDKGPRTTHLGYRVVAV